MTNFKDPKPFIDKSKELPPKSNIDKSEAIKAAVKLIKENRREIEKNSKFENANLHR